MEYHNPTDVQSVPSVDALHLVNKKHKEEVDKLQKEIAELRENLSASRTSAQSIDRKLKEFAWDTDYLEQDELKDDFIALHDKFIEAYKTAKEDVLLIAEAQYSDSNNNMNTKVIDELVDMYKDLMEKLVNYEFMYKWSVSGTVDFSISEIEAKDEEEAQNIAHDMCHEGFFNGDCEVDDVNADNIEQQ
jgi:predicted RNase H-like nuclease (RuvC/YqgF family)